MLPTYIFYLWIFTQNFLSVFTLLVPRSCRDIVTTSNGTDGEYVIFLKNNVGITVFCTGMQPGRTPQEYLTLPTGRSNNFAYYYENIGKSTDCSMLYPLTPYKLGGKAEYSKIRIKNLDSLTIESSDHSFSMQVNYTTGQVDYGTAGDKYSSSTNCPPRGIFKIDLRLTPFVVSPKVKWTWSGSYPNTKATGTPFISNTTYVGCFIDKDDRMLPAQYLYNNHMTVDMCIQHCRSRGFAYSGVQYYAQCFCGDNHNKHGAAVDTQCNTPCKGNHQQMCGGTWRLSIYGTGLPQTIIGRCGGYPGQCFPTLKNDPGTPALMLQFIPTHPCLQPLSPCKNEGKCIAVTDTAFKCLCYNMYSGSTCDIQTEQIVTMGALCPAGLYPEKCTCVHNKCSGAKFDGDTCVTTSGEPKVLCRYSDPGHVILFNVEGSGTVICPSGSQMVGCSYWDSSGQLKGNGEADNAQYTTGTCSMRHGCQQCRLQARCKKFDCGCQNGGHCHMVTGECICNDGYYGSKCESFDYCSFYEKQNGQSACGSGGICNAVPANSVKTYGGDNVGDHCIFPFTYNGTSYGTCIESNDVGPPFSCGSVFDGTREGYVDLGMWSPGSVYTMAAWVRPDKADGVRRTIIGGVGDCLDYGIYHFENFWVYYKGTDSACTRGIDTGVRIQTGEWYLVAAIQNGTHVISYVNGKQSAVKVNPNVLPTTSGLWIGGEVCCPTNRFKGMIKTVKVWKRPLQVSELEKSMNHQGNDQATEEALHGGLVGQWELGEVIQPPCAGIDHGGEDWTLKDGQQISGTHCNISTFTIPRGSSVIVIPYNGTTGGKLEIVAESIQIDGVLNGIGAGYRGGPVPLAGQSGQQGQSYSGLGQRKVSDNRGGGGGGVGGNFRADHAGEPGAGGGYGTVGKSPVKIRGDRAGFGQPGKMYGDGSLKQMFLGSGGGSGGSAKDGTKNPSGGRGGNGGGSISLKSLRSVVVTGLITVSGEDGQGDNIPTGGQCSGCPGACSVKNLFGCHGDNRTACWDMSGPGGGGSGGSIYLAGKVVNVGQKLLWTMGGRGGFGTLQGCGGDGGLGRIRVDAAIFKGSVTNLQGVFTQSTLQNEYVDHSQAGQKLIDYTHTNYGNEVYRGCFNDPDIGYRTLAYTAPLTNNDRSKMTPDFCMKICRDKGYQFSGTEYAYECYCDNHLRMDRKMPEGDCHTACRGDGHKFCGGTNRISVFGPPPGTPAFAHRGVVQKCQPWCLTADVETTNPKWGQCSMKTQEVTSWQIVCQCPIGYQGFFCNQPCKQGTWGKNCANNCSCNSNNTQFCDPIIGLCKCSPGYHDDQCNTPCPTGYYGVNCAGVCNCSKANSQCNPRTGNCMCNSGWMGSNCQYPCPSGHYGQDCKLPCLCNNQGSCDPVGGTCQCNPGYMLPTCVFQCERGTYGPDCGFFCNCNNQPCDPVTGLCQCGPGFKGQHCELECPIGFYGQFCEQKCQCAGKYGCDHVTGACHCGPGFVGQKCDVACPPGSFGINCAKRCNCYNQPCDGVTGLCKCNPGYRGHQCELKCPLGRFGNKCKQTCACKNGASCDGVTGTCLCPPGWRGNMCEMPCPTGYGGLGCNTSCPADCGNGFCSKATGSCICTTPGTKCECPAGFYGSTCQTPCDCVHGTCDKTTGNCLCVDGWFLTTCASPCPTDTYGAGCNGNCNCNLGDCDPLNGKCICPPGKGGAQCDKPCQGGTYGPGCLITCPPCGKYAQNQCDPATGACVCKTGYTGSLCDQPCPQGYSGVNCSSKCNCKNSGLCRSTDGVCLCPDGFTGSQCELKCSTGTWGENCTNNCSCGYHGDGCDFATGACHCKPGFSGAQCGKSCPVLTYGQDCDQSCDCNPEGTSSCSPIDGSCQCKSGYHGNICFEVCSYGAWGRNCSQRCQCGSNGNCNPFTGACFCSPGYIGKNCQQMCLTDQYYGFNCSKQCNCNGGHCDPTSGRCECKPGSKGHHCEQKCGPTHFGIQCAQVCGCKNGAVCDAETGNCRCQPGWFGTLCDQSCPAGQYGVDCSMSCPDCQNGGLCDGTSGMCVCLSGFIGSLCNQTCSQGYWGLKCQMKCPNTCQLGCQPQTGICNCSPGSCLNHGFCSSSGLCLCKDTFYGDRCQNTTGRYLMQQSQSGASYSLSKAQLVGLVIGIIALIVLIVVGVIFIMKKKYTGVLLPSGLSRKYQQDTQKLEEVQDDGSRGFSNPLADGDNDNTVISQNDNSDA
ncbi:uncharacterized protein LOC134707479 isoform X1 [Mytilus trossulus]|uniref:uncharacterized protein LOC134707479 isoform X1 n=1 Tax=Mytilus trossulus TaxID=6551 RepID=UPI0030054716